MCVNAKNEITIDQNWLDANRGSNGSFVEKWLDYTGKATGALRVIQVIKGLASMQVQIASTPSPVAHNLIQASGAAVSSLGVVRLPSATQDAFNAVSNLNADNGMSSERKVGIAIKDSMDAISAWGNSFSFVMNNPSVRSLTQFTDLTTDVCDFSLSVSDYSAAEKLEEVAIGDVKGVLTHTKNYYALRIAKAVVSVAAGILAIAMFLTGALFVPAFAMTLLSISSALLAIQRDLSKDNRVINFDHSVRV
jgi:hypothetical protein